MKVSELKKALKYLLGERKNVIPDHVLFAGETIFSTTSESLTIVKIQEPISFSNFAVNYDLLIDALNFLDDDEDVDISLYKQTLLLQTENFEANVDFKYLSRK